MKDENFKFIEDQELNLKNNDLLNTYPYVGVLKKIIDGREKNSSFRIALYGSWGSGKSSIIKTLKDEIEIETQKDNKNIKFIDYDAWKFSNDSFRRSFLIELSQKIGKNPLRDFFVFGKFNTYLVLIFIFSIFFGSLYYFYNVENPFLIFSKADNFTTHLTIAIVILTFFLNKLWELYKKRVEQPEEFEEVFKSIINSYFYEHTVFIESKKLIIVIDNIDRIGGKVAVDILLSIRNFLNIDKNVIFIIPIDKTSIEKAFSQNHEEKNYLKKLFDLEVYIKEHIKQNLFTYAKELINKNFKHWNLEEEQISNIAFFISQSYSNEPRKIIKFLNLLNVEFELYKIKEKDINDTLPDGTVTTKLDFLAKILIIREEWPLDYKALALKPSYFLGERYKELNKDETKNNKHNMSVTKLISLKKEINSEKPHYFLGWNTEILDIISELLDDKSITWKDLKKRYNKNPKTVNIKHDISIFLIALEYKLRELNKNEHLYKIIFDISNDDKFSNNKRVMKPLSYILKNYYIGFFNSWIDGGNSKYVVDKKYFVNSAIKFSKFDENFFLNKLISNFLNETNINNIEYAFELFKSCDNNSIKIEKFKEVYSTFFNLYKDKTLDTKEKELFSKFLELDRIKDFKEFNFLKNLKSKI